MVTGVFSSFYIRYLGGAEYTDYGAKFYKSCKIGKNVINTYLASFAMQLVYVQIKCQMVKGVLTSLYIRYFGGAEYTD